MKVIGKTVLQLVAVVVISALGGQALAAVQGKPWLMLAAGLLTAAAAVAAYAGLVRLTEKRRVDEVGRTGLVGGLSLGTVLGVAVFALVVVNIWFLGYYHVNGPGQVGGAVGLFGFMAAAAVTEELMFRGVLFRVIERRTGTWLAMLLTGLLFGAYHLANPDASVWGALAIVVEAGSMLTAAYVATRRLWVPIGLHFGWNFAAAAIFSTEVSGNGSNHGLLDATMSGPSLVTGGSFGPEGSLYSVVFCLLTAVVFLWVAHRRGRIVPMGGQRLARLEAATTLPR
ncbi:CPBP family intramembrane glutamic endopeptidase [Actinocatenispora rupis]|uniref:CAAX amino protease n=1 Tax=Actinocatenispora rupis TaxID=519421 RepID=A0A8J3NGP2_9ACTN|nr:CPBP family intramembrane glutamic endopeptidase [Actinocatenispora rupis]GID16190.1 CAAX amino protease [Actinocatenispora rupis]